MDPRYSFVEGWDHNGIALIEMDGTLFRVKRLDGVPGSIFRTEFRAYYGNGPAVATAGKFTSLLRKLHRWSGAT